MKEFVVSITYEELTEIYTCKCGWYIWYVGFISCVLNIISPYYIEVVCVCWCPSLQKADEVEGTYSWWRGVGYFACPVAVICIVGACQQNPSKMQYLSNEHDVWQGCVHQCAHCCGDTRPTHSGSLAGEGFQSSLANLDDFEDAMRLLQT